MFKENKKNGSISQSVDIYIYIPNGNGVQWDCRVGEEAWYKHKTLAVPYLQTALSQWKKNQNIINWEERGGGGGGR